MKENIGSQMGHTKKILSLKKVWLLVSFLGNSSHGLGCILIKLGQLLSTFVAS